MPAVTFSAAWAGSNGSIPWGEADIDQMLAQALVFLGSGLGSSYFD